MLSFNRFLLNFVLSSEAQVTTKGLATLPLHAGAHKLKNIKHSPQNCGRQKGDKQQVSCGGVTNFRRRNTKFSANDLLLAIEVVGLEVNAEKSN